MNERKFYKNISGSPTQSRLADGSEVGSTNIPIIKTIEGEVLVDLFGTFQVSIVHDLKAIYEPLVRVREKGTTAWKTLPSYVLSPTGGIASTIRVQNITSSTIVLEFEGINNSPTYEYEIYFLDFKF